MHLSARQLRLASGSVLVFYVAWHLANHTLGLIAVSAAEAGRAVFTGFWRHPIITAAFYAALLAHIALALQSLVERRSLRMPFAEALRIVLGFAIPPLLAVHFTSTRLVLEFTGIEDSYARVVSSLWGSGYTLRQLAFLTLVWLHGCMGLNFAFRHRPGWRAARGWLVFVATLLPVLAACGYLAMARELEAQGVVPQALDAADAATIGTIIDALADASIALVVLALAWRGARNLWSRYSGRMVRIGYPGRAVLMPAGASVLEASRAHGIAHMSLCGGRARCSTCRVRVHAGADALAPPGHDEAATLRRIGAGPDVRLACQLRPRGPVEVEPLLAPAVARTDHDRFPGGSEREVVVLFADLRRWTGLAEEQLPMDLVYVLDRYFETVGDAVREAGGVPNQFIGDSVMALFGVDSDAATGARQALAAAQDIARRMALLNEELAPQFGRRLDFGIGIHAGLAAVGSVGYRDTRTLSAVGDAVNTASRLQELTKALKVRMVVSEQVLLAAGQGTEGWVAHQVELRGRKQPLQVYARDAVSGA